jgi:hypothetical protein
MRRALLGAFLILGLLAACDDKSKRGIGDPLPPSKEATEKEHKGRVVSDELPPPPDK